MRFSKMTALAVFALMAAACSASGDGNTAGASTEVETNLEAESFDTTITSDEASSLNEAESRQLNVTTE